MNNAPSCEFSIHETQGILLRSEHCIRASSKGFGWESLFVSQQREGIYEDTFRGAPNHMLILHLDGPVTVRRTLGRDTKRRRIPPGGVFSMPANQDFGVSLEQVLETVHVYLRGELIDAVAADLFRVPAQNADLAPLFGEPDALLETLMKALAAQLEVPSPCATIYADYLAHALSASLLRRSQQRSSASEVARSGTLSRRQLDQTLDFAESALEQPVLLRDLARAAGLTPTHFARRFRQTLGVAPHQYLIRLRVERAKRLLTGSGQSIAQISAACGFSNQEHLTRVFKRLTGTTPAVFRRNDRH